MNVLGIVIARGKSKEIPQKNLLKIGGKTLVELAIESAANSKMLTRHLLSTDDEKIINVAKKTGIDIPFIRPRHLAKDDSSVYDVMKHAIEWLEQNEGWSTDIAVLLQSTTPFRKAKHIDSVINQLIKLNSDASIAVVKPDYPPHWMLTINEKHKITRLIKNKKPFFRRQDTPSTLQPAGMVYAIKKDFLYKLSGPLPQGNTTGVIVNQEDAINIDTYIQYQVALSLWKKNFSKK